MAAYEDKMEGVPSQTDDALLAALETEITDAFNSADDSDDLDAMSAAAAALETVRARRSELSSEAPAAEAPTTIDESVVTEPVTADGGDGSDLPDFLKKKDDAENTDESDVSDDAMDETVTASAETDTTDKAKEANVDIPEDRQPVVTSPVSTILAGADIPGFAAGSEFTSADQVSEAMVKRIDAYRNVRGSDGEKVIVASIKSPPVSPERTLVSGEDKANVDKINKLIEAKQSMSDTEALTASGGYCAPLEVRYDIFGLGVADRPVRDALAGFNATRGGIRYTQPPVLSDLAGAVGIWTGAVDSANSATVSNKALTSNVATITTSAAHGFAVGQRVTVNINDAAFDGSWTIASVPTTTTFTYARTHANVTSAAAEGTAEAVKPVLKVVCSSELTATLDAVTLRLEFGNLMARAFPELVSRNNELGLIQHARIADLTLLSKISALSTAVTSSAVLGFARDFLEAVGRAAAGYRHRHRMGDDAYLRVLAPAWVKDAIREDLTRGLPGDQLDWADSVINGFFATRRVNITWHLDDGSTLSNAQSSGALNAWPTTFKWNLFAEGTFLFLDGGTLDLGIVRDSDLVGTNDYQMFVETFEGVAKVGIEALEVTTTTGVYGATALGVDTVP